MTARSSPVAKTLRILIIALLLISACSPADRAVELEERILAPCCWRQSVRDHESDIATKLRTEIETRIRAGESSDAIENDLVRRYGAQIRALPAGHDPRWMVSSFVGLAVIAGLLWVVTMGRRRTRLVRSAAPIPDVEDAYEERLDDELGVFDD